MVPAHFFVTLKSRSDSRRQGARRIVPPLVGPAIVASAGRLFPWLMVLFF